MAVIAQSTTEATAAGRMNPTTSDAPVAASSLPQRATRSCLAGLSRRSIGYRSRSTTSARPLTEHLRTLELEDKISLAATPPAGQASKDRTAARVRRQTREAPA